MSKLLTIPSILLARMGAQSINIPLPILCESQRNKKTVETQTLIDSGAGEDFLHQDFATKHRIDLPLDTPIIPQNVDGTLNIGGKITHYVYINILFNSPRIGTKLLVTNIGKNNLILGLPWLKKNNPQIDWKTGQMELTKLTHEEQIAAAMRRDRERWAKKMLKKEPPLKKRDEETPIAIVATMEQMINKEELWINVKTGVAQELAQKEAEKQKTKTLKEMIPSELMNYCDVFDKKKAEWFPEPRAWNHTINLKPDFVPNYNIKVKRLLQNEKDLSISPRYLDPSHTNWNFQNNGRSTPCSTPPFPLSSKKTTSMDPITLTHHWTLSMENQSMKLKQ